MKDDIGAFVSDETSSSSLVVLGSQFVASDVATTIGGICTSDGETSKQNKVQHWASEQSHIDDVIREADDWEKAETFFSDRDHSLNEALRLAYPVFVLLSLRRDEAEFELKKYQEVQNFPKNLIRNKPALAALKLVTKPKNVDQSKRCSEWSYKLHYAISRTIIPSEFFEFIQAVSLADAKAEVRRQRRNEAKLSGKFVDIDRPVIRVTIRGKEGNSTFKSVLDDDHYRALLSADKNKEYENASHMLGYLKGMRSGFA